MSDKPLVILGSSRSNGDTRHAVDLAMAGHEFELVDLLNYNFTFYDYEYRNRKDDFQAIVPKMLGAEKIIFATPVYWYAMSAPLKIFIDRFSDLVRVEKNQGRQLEGKKTFLISSGTDDNLPQGFEIPFQRTSEYLDMDYQGAVYLYSGGDNNLRQKSAQKIGVEFTKLLNN
ncbi:MAG: NADPH-dependent oxidoreductase [Alphaproteobacteria bacterium]|nr:MAG: NADPH-dependent oxidoreductase [Alphaproteobacteria bacterium]